MYAKPLHSICFTYRRMHIYPWQMDPPINHRSILHCHIQEVLHITEYTYTHDRLTPCLLTTDPCYTIAPSLLIDHRSMLHHYPHKSHIVHNSHIPMADQYTKAVSHVGVCHGRLTSPPPLIKHRCMKYHYPQ